MAFNSANLPMQLANVSGQGVGTVLSSTGGVQDNSPFVAILVVLSAGAAPSITPTVQWSHDGQTWFAGDPADTMTPIAAVSAVGAAKSFTRKAPFHRVSMNVTAGTGVAYQVYSWSYGA